MSISTFTTAITGDLTAIDWSSFDVSQYRDVGLDVITNAIFRYFDEKSPTTGLHLNFSLGGVAAGVTPPSVPYTDPTVNAVVTFLPASTLKSLLLSNLNAGMTTVAAGSVGFWTALNLWFNASLAVSLLNSSTIIPIVGAGIITFPNMPLQQSLHLADISSNPPNTLQTAWTKVCQYILNGLQGAIISPIPTTGIAPGGPFTGTTTLIATFPI